MANVKVTAVNASLGKSVINVSSSVIGPAGADGAEITGPEVVALIDTELGGSNWQGPGEITDGATFTGAVSLSNIFGTYYDDYTTGGTVNLTLAASPVVGGSATVRVRGDLTGTIPALWNFSGDTLSTSASEYNELVFLYVSGSDIRIINRVVDAPDATAPTISSFTIADATPTRITFSSSEIITATTFAGFTLGSGKTITGITILRQGQYPLNYFHQLMGHKTFLRNLHLMQVITIHCHL